MATATEKPKRAEIKTRTYEDVKENAKEVYAHWGLSLNDAVNMFLVKSIEVGGLPFNLRTEVPSYESLSAHAYKATMNKNGVAVLPADWDEDDN